MSTTILHQFLSKGESQTLDFKENITNSNKIAKTIVSFANTDGGIIVVGVKDNLSLIGIAPEEEKFMINHAIENFCKPKPICHFSITEEQHMSFLIVEIQKGKTPPYFAKNENQEWIAYQRVNDHSLKASGVWLLLQKYKNKGLQKFFINEKDKEILTTLNNQKMDFKTLAKNSKLNYPSLVKTLAKLIYLELVNIYHINNTEMYETCTVK
jgi:predicted HTH transcriptional regulator